MAHDGLRRLSQNRGGTPNPVLRPRAVGATPFEIMMRFKQEGSPQ